MSTDLLQYVLEYFEYKSGGLYWKKNPNNVVVGSRAGTIKGHLYRRISVRNKVRYEHHLVWLYHYGVLPREIDHINGKKEDNRIENLREVTRSQNIQNKKVAKSLWGFTGVTRAHTKSMKWSATICVSRVGKYLGQFDSPEEAAKAYDKAAVIYYGPQAKLNFPVGVL